MTSKTDHLERTATEPRDKSLNTVVLQHIEETNSTTRVFRLGIPRDSPPIRFLPGQWLDVYVPGVEKAGGFTITSTPREARTPHPALVGLESESGPGSAESENRTPSRGDKDGEDDSNKNSNATQTQTQVQTQTQGPYLELAVQKSPDNPPAAWLWRDPPTSVLGAELRVRVGGSFVWPPPGVNVRALRRVVFVAGGMGVNPLVSMLSSLASSSSSPPAAARGGDFEVHFLYSLRDPCGGAGGRGRREAGKMLFLDRIARVFREGRVKGRLEVFLTTGSNGAEEAQGEKEKEGSGGDGDRENVIAWGDENEDPPIPFHPRRCTVEDDVVKAVGGTPAERRFAVVYVCGVPAMTDEFVATLTDRRRGLGMEPHRVLCEKWW
ncbi:hypothetical protein F5Y14DRAFT_421157 [Nemania sp. NC0429]|nr:hypothetical protein F5Y14DRAFT_421157 [Nemania sp. NC0429]